MYSVYVHRVYWKPVAKLKARWHVVLQWETFCSYIAYKLSEESSILSGDKLSHVETFSRSLGLGSNCFNCILPSNSNFLFGVSTFQINLWNTVPRLCFLQGCENEKYQRICEYFVFVDRNILLILSDSLTTNSSWLYLDTSTAFPVCIHSLFLKLLMHIFNV